MDAQALLKERKELFENAIAFEHNKRVPMLGCFYTWKYLDAGYRLDEALYDYDLMGRIEREFIETYQYDAYSDHGMRNGMKAPDALGAGSHKITPDGEAVVVHDGATMEADEYAEYMADPVAFSWTKTFKRSVKPGLTLGDIKTAAMETIAFGMFGASMAEMYTNEFGALLTLNMSNMGMLLLSPIEMLFNGIRGIRGLSHDIMKNKAQLKEYLEYSAATSLDPLLDPAIPVDGSKTVADYYTPMLGHSILSTSQFGELYWPYMKKYIDFAAENNRTIYVFCESTLERFVEYFQEVPKGVLLIHLEQDNIFDIRKKLPNVALAGGMPTELLGRGTKEQCVDYAKRLIDELGEGFVISQDKMMSFRNDGKRENLIAVNDFVRTYEY